MRPITLEVEGFGAFRDRVEIDFEDADLFALVGPTGAGKSTVIDAICFALYGSVPRYDDERRVGDAVTLGRQVAKVGLTFELGGVRYVVAREVRRDARGKATTKEARLERMAPDGATEVVEGKVREANVAIERLLGMPFEHFTRCVVLPQGEFARFLHDKPADRQDLLAKLLNLEVYTRMGHAARARAAELTNQAAVVDAQLAKLAGATPEALAAARHRVDSLESLRRQVAETRPRVDALDEAMAESRRVAADARVLVERLSAVGVPDDVAEAGSRLADARAHFAAAEATAAETDEAVTRLEAERQALPPLAPLEAARAAHDDLAAARGRLSDARSRRQTAEAAEQAAAAARQQAEAVLATATGAVAAAERDHTAHALAAHLVVGEPCPVCEHPVAQVPTRSAPPEVDAAARRARDAEKAHKDADAAHRTASEALAAARTAVHAHTDAVAGLEERVADHPDPAVLQTLIATVTGAEAALQKARESAALARRAVGSATKEVAAVEATLADAAAAFEAQRDPLVALRPPGRTGADLPTDWQALAVWATTQVPAQKARAEAAEAEAARLGDERDEVLTALAAAAGEQGVRIPPGDGRAIDRLAEGVAAELAEGRQAATTIEAQMADAERLAAEGRDLRHRADVARTLGGLLSSTGFERWLVEEALHVLVEDASITLRRLSNEAYSLTINERNEFQVIDHRNADERRPAKTLSGGETFQASLALALALADQLADLAAEGGADLDAIFLDEGFGTLDDETLDVVASTIETLGAGERMVGLVTHVKELAARVPVRYEVHKGTTGSTVEKVVV